MQMSLPLVSAEDVDDTREAWCAGDEA